MTQYAPRLALSCSAVFVLVACGIESESSVLGTSATGGKASGGRGGSFVAESGGSTGQAGKGASTAVGGAGAGHAGSSAGGSLGEIGGAGGNVSGAGAGGGAGSSVAGNGSGSLGGATSTGSAGEAGASAGAGNGSSTDGGSGGSTGGTTAQAGGQGGNVATGGNGSSTGGSGGISSEGGAGGAFGMAGAPGAGGMPGTGGTLGTGGLGTGGRAGGGPGPKCGDGKVEPGEDCDPQWSPSNPTPNAYTCNAECKLCPGVLILGDCFFVARGAKGGWDAAEGICAAESAHLAAPSFTEFEALKKLPGGDDVLWAAVRQAENAASAKEGWTWRAGSDAGKPVSSLIWSADEPNDSGDGDESTPGEDCGAVIRSRGMKYDDKACTDSFAALCQRNWD